VVLAAGAPREEPYSAADRWAGKIVTQLGVAYVNRDAARAGALSTSYSTPDPAALSVRGFDYLLPIRDSAKGQPDSVYQATWSGRPLAVRVLRARDTLLVIPLDSMLARLREREARRPSQAAATVGPGMAMVGMPRTVVEPRSELFIAVGESPAVRARVHVRYIGVKDSAGTRRVESLTGRVLLALKK
jgi:hypothetical protein